MNGVSASVIRLVSHVDEGCPSRPLVNSKIVLSLAKQEWTTNWAEILSAKKRAFLWEILIREQRDCVAETLKIISKIGIYHIPQTDSRPTDNLDALIFNDEHRLIKFSFTRNLDETNRREGTVKVKRNSPETSRFKDSREKRQFSTRIPHETLSRSFYTHAS